MEIIDPEQKQQYESRRSEGYHMQHNNNNGRIIGGVIIIAIGTFLLAKKMGIYIPSWIMSWQMLLIAIGFLIGAKNSFRPGGWMIAILVGSVFLLDRFIPDINIKPYIWPVLLIIIGLFLIVTPAGRGTFRQKKNHRSSGPGEQLTDDIIDSTSIFGGVKKNVISKDFKGGEVTAIFGGTELNLSQADINGKVHLEINQLFGGTTLIVPSNWQVQSETTSIFGNVEDTRSGSGQYMDPNKVLIIDGTSVFGGISIKSY